MNMLRSETPRTILSLGLLSGAFILFTGAVGMIAAFHEREVVDRFISLGQLSADAGAVRGRLSRLDAPRRSRAPAPRPCSAAA